MKLYYHKTKGFFFTCLTGTEPILEYSEGFSTFDKAIQALHYPIKYNVMDDRFKNTIMKRAILIIKIALP